MSLHILQTWITNLRNWDPYLTKDIEKLERVQRQAARFIPGDYHSREDGSVTKMLETLELETLERRRSSCRLIFLFKVVEGLVPAINPDEFLKSQKPKRHIKPKAYPGYKSVNIVEKHSVNNDRGFIIEQCKTDQLKNSFFVKTIIEWNHLETAVVHAETVEGFKTLLSKRD